MLKVGGSVRTRRRLDGREWLSLRDSKCLVLIPNTFKQWHIVADRELLEAEKIETPLRELIGEIIFQNSLLLFRQSQK